MKRIIILVLGILLLAGCGVPTMSPDQVVNEYWKLHKEGKAEEAQRLIVEGREKEVEIKLVAEDEKTLLKTLLIFFERKIEITTKGFEKDGEKAIVNIIISKPNCEEALIKTTTTENLRELIENASNIEHEGKAVMYLVEGEWKIYAWELDSLEERMNALRERCIDGELIKVEANPEKGFHWPYFLSIPTMYVQNEKAIYLLVEGNASPEHSDDYNYHVRYAKNAITTATTELGRPLKIPIITPIFPRLKTGRYADNNKYLNAPFGPQRLDKHTITRGEGMHNQFDLQTLAMIEDANEKLEELGIDIHKQFLMHGFSTSGDFANRMLLLHPEKIRAVAMGGHSCPSVPVSTWNNTYLPFAIGTGGFKEITGNEFNMDAFIKTPIFLYRGAQDFNDLYEFSRPPHIISVFGTDPVKRVFIAEEIFNSVSANFEVKIYEGVGHSIIPEMWEDIRDFFQRHAELD